MKYSLAAGALCSAFIACTSAAQSSPSIRDVYRAALAVRDFGSVDISPDGGAIAWQAAYNDMQGSNETRRRTALFVARNGGPRVRLTAGSPAKYYDEENPVWSPDGRSLAFLSDARTPSQLQIFVAAASAKRVRAVSRLTGNIQGLRWTPDGTALSVLYISSAHRSAGALAPGARDVGVVGSVVDEQRLAVVDAATGALTTITPANDYVYEYDWKPDGSAAAVTYAAGDGDNNWWIAKLATVPRGGGALHDVLAPRYQINNPRWSPDGRRIAFIGGIMSDFGPVGGDVYLADAGGGVVRDVAPGMPVSAAALQWTGPGRISMVVHDNGAMHLESLNVSDGARATILGGNDRLASVAVTRDGTKIALVRS